MLNTLNITPYQKLAVPTPTIKGVPLDPSVLNTFKEKENKFEINPIVSQSANGLVSGFNKMSEFSKNSYENANKTFYDNQSAYEGLNKNLYTTSQDLYGKTYFQKGGIKEEYENIRSLYDTFNSVGESDLASIYSDQLQNLEPEYQKLTLDQYAEQQRTIEDLNSKVRFLENQSSQDTPLVPYSQKYPIYNSEEDSLSYVPNANVGFRSPQSFSKNQSLVKEYLTSKGLSKNAIAGIMANIEHESSFNPSVAGDRGMSHGLFQHYDKRKNNLLSYLQQRNLPTNSIEGQIDFALSERPDVVQQVNKARSPQEAADIWTRKFEIPANINKQSKMRQQSSLKYFKNGGNINDNLGYLVNNLKNFTPVKRINSDHITTQGMAFPIYANGYKLYPNTGNYIFPSKSVLEIPAFQKGGGYYYNPNKILPKPSFNNMTVSTYSGTTPVSNPGFTKMNQPKGKSIGNFQKPKILDRFKTISNPVEQNAQKIKPVVQNIPRETTYQEMNPVYDSYYPQNQIVYREEPMLTQQFLNNQMLMNDVYQQSPFYKLLNQSKHLINKPFLQGLSRKDQIIAKLFK